MLDHHQKPGFPPPPNASIAIRRMATRIAAPVDEFLHTQSAGGVLLVVTATCALLWANFWPHSYHSVWHAKVTLGFGLDPYFEPITMSLQHWINDLLMTIFFMVAGFEIKREIAQGELSERKRAMLPIAAALGGMVVPAVFYAIFNAGTVASSGWGIPMATDIAFAVGILVLLGDRVPAALRILLLAVAIIDDLGAILVIAIFYTDSVSVPSLVFASGGLLVLWLYRKFGVRPGASYLLPLGILWLGLYHSGVHATLAGVIVGMSAPVKPWLSKERFLQIAKRSVKRFEKLSESSTDDAELLRPISLLSVAGREAVSPVVRLEKSFHPWVAFVIMPLFAVANAGVEIGGITSFDAAQTKVLLGIITGLVIGKPLGIVVFSFAMVKLGLCKLPRGVSWSGMLVLGMLAGIGFTMSIFIGDLAFKGQTELLTIAKLGILIATAFAGAIGMGLGRFVLPKLQPDIAAVGAAEAEASTEL